MRVLEWGDSTKWQYWVIDRVKRYTEERGYDGHPMGMTMQFPVKDQTRVNKPLLESDALTAIPSPIRLVPLYRDGVRGFGFTGCFAPPLGG
jgi:hypothetical protein